MPTVVAEVDQAAVGQGDMGEAFVVVVVLLCAASGYVIEIPHLSNILLRQYNSTYRTPMLKILTH